MSPIKMDPVDALKQKSIDYYTWIRGGGMVRCLETLKTPCPKCGSETIRACTDMGVVDYVDVDVRVCLNPKCDYLERDLIIERSW